MIDTNKIIFFTGAPGSKWSGASVLLANTPLIDINISDRSPEREYDHGPQFNGVKHLGAYFGPGFEFGEWFHELYTGKYTREQVIAEIERAYPNHDGYIMVKCHQFVYSLDWIAETFPESKIMIVMRHPEACWDGWHGVGGIKIPYPDYTEFYKTTEQAKKLINHECMLARKWIYERDLAVHTSTPKHWRDIWQLDEISTENIQYTNSLIGYHDKNDNPTERLRYDVQISYYNFERK